MKIETLPREDHQVTITVELENEKMEGARRRAARKIAQRIKIPGFRPGKAPYEVIIRSAGESSVTEEAVEILVDEIYPQVIEEAGIKPAAPGSLEEITNVDPPKFKFLVPLQPVVELGDYRSIREQYDWQPPIEEKVNESIEELRRMYSTTENVDRPIKVGDFVLTDVKGTKVKSKSEDKPFIDKPGNPVFIRPGDKPEEWPFQGFSKKLVGMTVDEIKTFSHKYPNDFEDETLKGLAINFEVKVKTIRGMILPELNDEFAKKVGGFETIEELKKAVRANLDNQSKAEYDDKYFEKVIEEIKVNATIKYPPQILAHESEHVLEDLKHRLSQQNLELDVYLKMRGLDHEKFIQEEVTPVAIRRLERSLILDQIAVEEKIEVSEERLNSAFQQTWSELQLNENFQKAVKKKPSQKMMESIAMQSASRAMIQLTLDRMKLIATGEAPEIQKDSNLKKNPPKKKTKLQPPLTTEQDDDVNKNEE